MLMKNKSWLPDYWLLLGRVDISACLTRNLGRTHSSINLSLSLVLLLVGVHFEVHSLEHEEWRPREQRGFASHQETRGGRMHLPAT